MDSITNDQYRETARRLYGSREIRVSEWAGVQPVREEGAFVEVQVWVPASEVREGGRAVAGEPAHG